MAQLRAQTSNNSLVPSLLAEAGRLKSFSPPFQFSNFFSPEDTLLCMLASEAALAHARSPGASLRRAREPLRIMELTSGSGLIGLHLLRIERNSTLVGTDVDDAAVKIATANATRFGLQRRARFSRADLKSRNTENLVARERPQLLICNPPYIPEPQESNLAPEAGAGHDGTDHLMRAIAIARANKPRSFALSWCSLSNPENIVRTVEKAGYCLNSLFVTIIADGEYSGAVENHLRGLNQAYLHSGKETLDAVASDGSASFAFLLMAGEFSREPSQVRARTSASDHVRTICSRFARRGMSVLNSMETPFTTRSWILDRWDEVQLRALLHGSPKRAADQVA